MDRTRFGCPPLEAERTVVVTALPRVSLPAFPETDLIQPGPLFPSAPLPMADKNWFKYTMAPAAETLVLEMISIGRTHAGLWAENDEGSVAAKQV